MKLILALKTTLLATFLLAGMVASLAQTSSPLDYSRMGLLELSTRANKGDQNAADALKKRLNSDAYQPKPKKNANESTPSLPVLGASKGLGELPSKFKETPASTSKKIRSIVEITKEIVELQEKLKARIAKVQAGDKSASGKKETAWLLKKTKQLNAELKVAKLKLLIKQLGTRVGSSNKTTPSTSIRPSLPTKFVWTMNPAELKALAEKGDPKAQIELADRYERGGKGFDKDATASFSWMLKASNSGNVHAQNFTASNYYYGKGVAKDDAKAAHWLRKSAENGNEYAQFMLHNELEGPAYFGWGIFDKNLKEAEYWLNKAAAQGFLVATEHKKKYHSGQ